MAGFLRLVLGVAMLPAGFAAAATAVRLLASAPAPEGWVFPPPFVGAASGAVVFLVVWMFAPAPVRLYVLGHELTHAVWGLAFGARVGRLRVGPNGGSVQLSKSNVWITLSPYFFPFWATVVALAALVTRCFVSPLPWPAAWFFAIGFCWCFHVCFTVRSLMQRQPDVAEYGRVFSWTLIFVMNMLVVAAWAVFTGMADWRTALATGWRELSGAYAVTGGWLWAAARRVAELTGLR